MNQKFLLATFPLGYRRDTDNYCFYGLWTVELKGVLLHYPHPPEPVSAPDKEERMVQAARMQADKQCRMQGQQPMVLHVSLSGPGTEANPVPEQLWPHPAVTKLSGRVPALPGQEHSHQGREVALSEGWWRSDTHPCAGSGEERKESGTARGGTTPNFSG